MPRTDLIATIDGIAPGVPPAVTAALARWIDVAPTEGALEAVVDWLDSLFDWLRGTEPLPLPRTAPVSGRSTAARVWLLVRVLDAAPESRTRVREAVRRLLRASSALSLFTDTGRHTSGGFVAEAVRRLTRPLVPEAPEAGQLAYVVGRLFEDQRAADWLDEIPLGLVEDFMRAIAGPGRDPWTEVRASLIDSIDVLSTRIAALGLAEDVRVRGTGHKVSDAPFMRAAELGLWTAAQLRAVDEGEAPTMPPVEAKALLLDALAACDQEIGEVVAHLEEFGVSVNLVYRLDQITGSVDRVRTALEVLVPAPGAPRGAIVLRLFSTLLREQLRDRSLGALVRTSIRQLARKVIERNGATGEHYITASRDEWFAMLKSAAGGGALTALTTVVKFAIAALALPGLFLVGFINSMNYAASFVVLHLLGLTLATKQPSMTAARLASLLGEVKGHRDYVELVQEIARTARSQLAAVIGNLGAVIPVAVLIDLAWVMLTDQHFLAPTKADYTVASLDPLRSGTIVFAAFTGVLLWGSSVIAGSIDNWSVYRRLPDALQRHKRVRRWLGDDGAARFAASMQQNISGISGSIVLGFMLGMTSVFGNFFGLPIDVRHVTLSTGSLAFAVMSMGPASLLTEPVFRAIVGIGIIGLLNFGVSYALALMVALRAREVSRGDTARVAVLVTRRFFRDPWPFFVPPPSTEDDGAHHGRA